MHLQHNSCLDLKKLDALMQTRFSSETLLGKEIAQTLNLLSSSSFWISYAAAVVGIMFPAGTN